MISLLNRQLVDPGPPSIGTEELDCGNAAVAAKAKGVSMLNVSVATVPISAVLAQLFDSSGTPHKLSKQRSGELGVSFQLASLPESFEVSVSLCGPRKQNKVPVGPLAVMRQR